MAPPSKFTQDQISFIRREYLKHRLPPREVARACNEKFGTTFTSRQISTALAERGITKTLKLAKAHPAATSEVAAVAQGLQKAAVAPLKEMLEGHARFGALVAAKAEQFAIDATSAKTLSSAATAGKTGIAIIRQAAGLDASGTSLTLNVSFDPGFSRSDLSPFSEAGKERARLAAMKRAEPAIEEHNVPATEAPGLEENLASG